jgi:hypothetical protein
VVSTSGPQWGRTCPGPSATQYLDQVPGPGPWCLGQVPGPGSLGQEQT